MSLPRVCFDLRLRASLTRSRAEDSNFERTCRTQESAVESAGWRVVGKFRASGHVGIEMAGILSP